MSAASTSLSVKSCQQKKKLSKRQRKAQQRKETKRPSEITNCVSYTQSTKRKNNEKISESPVKKRKTSKKGESSTGGKKSQSDSSSLQSRAKSKETASKNGTEKTLTQAMKLKNKKRKLKSSNNKKKIKLENGSAALTKSVDTTCTSKATTAELDKNWKELAKKIGYDPTKQKKKMEETVSEDPEVKEKVTPSPSEDKIWFDGVDEIFLETAEEKEEQEKAKQSEALSELEKKLVRAATYTGPTKCLAMDCEMVGVGPDGQDSALARISIVNQYGHCVYDKFVKPKEPVTDYRTWVSGVRPEDLENAEELEVVQKEVDELVKGRILVGHAISNDEKALFMHHPKKYIRDTQKYAGYRKLVGGKRPGLKMLSQKVLGIKIQSGEHSSVQDAQATMRLYTLVRQKWEASLKRKKQMKVHKKSRIQKSANTVKKS